MPSRWLVLALSFSKRVEGSVRCPVVQVLWAAGDVTGKSIDGDFHQDFFCWCCGWPPLGLVEDGEEILQLFTLGVGIFPLSSQQRYLLLGLWLFLGNRTPKCSPEKCWLSPAACSTVVERADPKLLLVISSVLGHLENLSPSPAGHTGPWAARPWLARSSCSCRPVTLWP